jgi:hypothetical protein
MTWLSGMPKPIAGPKTRDGIWPPAVVAVRAVMTERDACEAGVAMELGPGAVQWPVSAPRPGILISYTKVLDWRSRVATTARCRDLGETALHVHGSKTERPRTIKLLAPLVQDLAEWRLASGLASAHRADLPDPRRR